MFVEDLYRCQLQGIYKINKRDHKTALQSSSSRRDNQENTRNGQR